VLEILNYSLKEKNIKKNELSKKIGCSRQNLHYHMKNLKNGRLTFNFEQVKIIKDVTGVDLLFFL
jgi:predicted transcriptional regulator